MTAIYNNLQATEKEMTIPTRINDNATKENKSQFTKEVHQSQCTQRQNYANTASRWPDISKNIFLSSEEMRNVGPLKWKTRVEWNKIEKIYSFGEATEKKRRKFPIL